MSDAPRCDAVVYKRDTYRVARDGKTKFRMHYTRCRCKRRAKDGPFCSQHARMFGIMQWTRDA